MLFRHNQESSAREAVQVVFGEIPYRPISFEERPELQEQMTKRLSAQGAIYVLTGMRGAGKSQLAGAIARRRLSEGWRLVAWINAEDPEQFMLELNRLAVELGLRNEASDIKASAMRVRHWLETGGERCLLVLDNATDCNVIRQFLPVAGRAEIIVTSSRRTLATLGTPLTVDVFTPAQSRTFLVARTGIDDDEGAEGVAIDLGYLPLALAQAAAVITGQNLDYATYRQRLADVRVADYLSKTEGDPYPRGVAEAITLSVAVIEADDSSQVHRQVLELVSVFSPSGTSRQLLYTAAQLQMPKAFPGAVQARIGSVTDVDAALQELVNSSLTNWSIDGTFVSAHRLVARVVRERADRDGTLSATAHRAVDTLITIRDGKQNQQRDPEGAYPELVAQIAGLNENLAAFPNTINRKHSLQLVALKAYGSGFRHGVRRAKANILAEQGKLDEAIVELQQLLVEVERDRGRGNRHAREIAEELNRLRQRRSSGE
jgi:hypothetical protein